MTAARCVLGPPHTPAPDTKQSQKFIVDSSTGLRWATVDLTPKSWDDALSACPSMLGAGWRLPSIKELASLASPGSKPPTDAAFSLQSSVYWSATPSALKPSQIWALDGTKGLPVTVSSADATPLARCLFGP
jgi:hypothetical protein